MKWIWLTLWHLLVSFLKRVQLAAFDLVTVCNVYHWLFCTQNFCGSETFCWSTLAHLCFFPIMVCGHFMLCSLLVTLLSLLVHLFNLTYLVLSRFLCFTWLKVSISTCFNLNLIWGSYLLVLADLKVPASFNSSKLNWGSPPCPTRPNHIEREGPFCQFGLAK